MSCGPKRPDIHNFRDIFVRRPKYSCPVQPVGGDNEERSLGIFIVPSRIKEQLKFRRVETIIQKADDCVLRSSGDFDVVMFKESSKNNFIRSVAEKYERRMVR